MCELGAGWNLNDDIATLQEVPPLATSAIVSSLTVMAMFPNCCCAVSLRIEVSISPELSKTLLVSVFVYEMS